MIENRRPNKPDQPKLEIECSVSGIGTKKIMFGTKVLYMVALDTLDKNALLLGAFKATQLVKITVEPIDEPEEANKERKIK